MERLAEGIFNIIHRGFWFHPAGMCSALQGSEGPFCVNSPQKDPPLPQPPPFTFLPTSPFTSVHLYFLLWFRLNFLKRGDGLSSCSVLRGSWERLNAVKVITQMTQNGMFFFFFFFLSDLPQFLDFETVSDFTFHPLEKQLGVALAAADLALLQHLEKCLFFPPFY